VFASFILHLFSAIAAAASALGRFTCMFNNAGVGAACDTLGEALSKWQVLRRMIDINVNACCLGTYLALEAFKRDGTSRGSVVTTASMAGLLPVGAPPIYSMTKAANIQFTRSTAAQLGGDASDIRVYALCPSYTATGLGPDPEVIKAALGGVLLPSHMAEGFMLLCEGDLPNGSVMRVTARRRGTRVVHDLVTYGKELGGAATPRPGIVIKEAVLEEYHGPARKAKDSFGNEMLSRGKL
jgi:NAD(P)-dependent dehydrogenase (short-subunit alcohol dehydrogenase family)